MLPHVPTHYQEFAMHDLQTIIKLNAPLNQRTPAATKKAYEIANRAKSEGVPALDQVEYGVKEETGL